MAFKKSLHNFTVVEAQNAALGQNGAVIIDGTDEITGPFVAVTALGCDFVFAGTPIGDTCCSTCSAPSVPGCTDETASNFDADATEDDGSCTFLVPPVCSGDTDVCIGR